tara:strand:+ start:3291 stop:3974 length:684 start_codon:yes stop_codon:yes gene_type:complete
MVIYMEKLQNKYRYERKYVLSFNQYNSIISELYRKNFYQIFKKRKINNIYFDNYNFDSNIDNIEGLSERKKFRLRWYGDTFDKSKKSFEIKIKNEFLNTKKIIPINKIKFNSYIEIYDVKNYLMKFFKKNNHLFFYNAIIDKHATLINSYSRKYFMNHSKSIRVTIDDNLKYHSPLTKLSVIDSTIVVELKYSNEIEFENYFRFLELAKFSKYVKGFLTTNTYKPNY